ncbi:MAG: serine/threonine-protein kinase, partial [Myxococcota bacterium]
MLRPGQVVDRYIVEEELGRGGMATVYRVRHDALGSLHALKVLTVEDPADRQRLLQEGRTQASLRHPNIVAVTDIVDIEGRPALVLEFVPGLSLDAWLRANRPSLAEAERLFRQILAGVSLAHRQGLVHRDLKPANILLDPSGGELVAKVADFGIVKMLRDDAPLLATGTGTTLGTPSYMAPEQIRDSKAVDARTDVFALGCILYELVCGRRAFVGEDILSLFNAIVDGRFEPPERIVPDLPERFGTAIRGCLTTSPNARIQGCEQLGAVLGGQP